MKPLTKQEEREKLAEIRKEREASQKKDPQWVSDYWDRSRQEDIDRIRRHLGWDLIPGLRHKF